MLDLLLDGVIAFGPERQVFYCNDAFFSIFEIGRNRLFSGRPIYELLLLSDKKLFLMPDGTDGEDDVLRYRPVTFETHHGRRGNIQVAIVPTREVFAKNKLWFAYFHPENELNSTKKVYDNIGALIEKGASLSSTELLKALSQIHEELARL